MPKKSDIKFTEIKTKTELDNITGKSELLNKKIQKELYRKKSIYHNHAQPTSKFLYDTGDFSSNIVMGEIHRRIDENEEENSGVESAHKLEQTAEGGLRFSQQALRSNIISQHRNSEKSQLNIQKAKQKKNIKRQYIKAGNKPNVSKTAKNTEKAVRTAEKETEKALSFIWRHRKGFLVLLVILLILLFIMLSASSCTLLFEGIGSAVVGTTYPSSDEDMKDSESMYIKKEQELQRYIDNYISSHDYDEYHFNVDEIGHDPYVLMSIITAYYGGEWKNSEVQGILEMIFEKQYELKEEITKETRYRTETRTGIREAVDKDTGEVKKETYTYEVQVAYEYSICSVTLKNYDMERLVPYILNEEQMERYALYIATSGNRPDLFETTRNELPIDLNNEYSAYNVSIESFMAEDTEFSKIHREARKYLGYPFVWGGSSPSTSFDCSGYVSWVLNHSGWDVGRLGAQGLYNICTPVSAYNVKPGDLVFFKGTYDTKGISHVGIYVGENTMIHCGNPVSYADLSLSYWQKHFYSFGRLPSQRKEVLIES